jgi:hypothetical protein
MATKRFDKRANFMMMSAEFAMLEALGAREGLSASDMVRQLIRRQHAAIFGDLPTTPTRTRKRK